MLLATVITEVVLASLVLLPLVLYRLKTQRWNRLTLDYPTNSHQEKLTILLPIWNESLVIDKKLSDLKRDYPFETSLLVIDSASDDDSVTKVNDWFSKNEGTFSTTQLIAMPERLGKTSAVKLALETLVEQNYQGLVLMTDADALIDDGAIIRLYGWFADSSIGAVGSSARRKTSLSGEMEYRELFEQLRQGESKIDSTPFLEGSCMMWRHGSFSPSKLNTASNADDAQITSLIRFAGLRTIFDPEAKFTDFAPSTIDGQRRQKIRRAQGLQTMLMTIPKQNKLVNSGKFTAIIRYQEYLHLTAPLLIFSAGMSAIIRWTYVSIIGMPVGQEALFHAGLGFLELTVLVAWLTNRNGIKLPLLNTIGTVFTGFEYLFISRVRILFRRQSNRWDQHSDTRELMSRN
jgi:cellulose synthase/poly-beta-1,6-N-acetylglucosamine synthase-like glycosyltransferase